MKTIKNLFLTILLLPVFTANAATDSTTSTAFVFAQGQINAMLDGKRPLSYEEAIYQVENAWWGGTLDYVSYQAVLGYHTDNIKLLMEEIRTGNKPPVFAPDIAIAAGQQQTRYNKLLANYAIYTYLTQPSLWLQGKKLYYNPACSYATADPMGTTDWTNTHVTRLLNEGTGNCFALASLYKILADRLGAEAELCTAPGHIYIRHADEQGSLHNIELGGRNFPGTGSIEAVTYTTPGAVKNGIALRPLNKEQQVALALVYLSKGREYRLGENTDFALACAETALKHDALNLNALLLKAEAIEAALLAGGETIEALRSTEQYKEYEQWLGHIYSLGYREMPLQMKNLLVQGWTRDTITKMAEVQYTQAEEAAKKTGGDTRYASTSWGLFNEDIRTETTERVNRTLYNTATNRIEGFTTEEQLYNHYNFDPVVFAWNMDPKTSVSINPYEVFGNNPIRYVDPNGDYFTEAKGSRNLIRLNNLKSEAKHRLKGYEKELQTATGDRKEQLVHLIQGTEGWLAHTEEMEKSDVEFHLAGSTHTYWDAENHRVIVGVGNPFSDMQETDDLGTMAHEMTHGYQFLTGKLTGWQGAKSNPLYDLQDEIEGRMAGTLFVDKTQTDYWHFTIKGVWSFYNDTHQRKESDYHAIRWNKTQLSTSSSASVLVEMKDNFLHGSALQVLKTNPNATIGDAIKYYNDYQQAHGSKARILTGKDLENR